MKIFDSLKQRSDKFQDVVDACSYILKNDAIASDAKTYLDSRISPEMQDKFEFGFYPSDKNLNSITSLVDPNILEELLLLYPKYISGGISRHGHFNNHNLIMPFRNVHGNIIALLGRSLLSDTEQKQRKLQKYKYTYRSNKQLHLFGLDLAKPEIIKSNCVVCVEGQFDYIACYSMGIRNVVAIGSTNISRYQFFQIHRYTNNIILLFDNDEAGDKAKFKLKNQYGGVANMLTISIPKKYKDIDEMTQQPGSNSTLDVMRKSLSSWTNFCTEI